jgi:tRNA-Thr(GGU) m(6)t(6)A37 methyltransferase TsaA
VLWPPSYFTASCGAAPINMLKQYVEQQREAAPSSRARKTRMTDPTLRPGEISLPFDPALTAADARLVFIGRVRTPWLARADCPKSMREARERHRPAAVEIDPPWRSGLQGLDAMSHVILLTFLHEARRDLIIQRPQHLSSSRGVFALRTPVRPNPIGLHIAQLLAVDVALGHLDIDAADCLDGTPLIDVKPYYAVNDSIPHALTR